MLKVGDFVLNTDSRKLYDKDKKEVALAPTLFSLLKFFIDHQNQTCSKDMIIDNVWKGKIVVEANVNQNIKKLRDVLGDSANDPRYIETVTGEGFRFVANSDEYRASPAESDSKITKILLFVSFLALAAMLINFFNDSSPETAIKELKPLTTLKGVETFPSVSADSKYILFNHHKNKKWNIILRPLDSESYYTITESEDREMFPAFSPSQEKFLYFSKNEKECGIYVRSIDLEKHSAGQPSLVKACDNVVQRMRANWLNEEQIFISINENNKSPSSIFQFDLNTKQQKLISKPDTRGFGDYSFNYSSKENKLAYIRNIGWSSSEIWLYDLATQKHNKLKSTPLRLVRVDWTNDGDLLYLSGNREISKLNIKTLEEEIVAKFSSRVFLPFLIDEKTAGVMTGEYTVIDIGQYDLIEKKNATIVSSSFNDYLGSKGNGFVSFISNRSGEPQVWIKDLQGTNTQVTKFTESFEIRELSASLENDFIIFNKSGHINIFDISGKELFNSENYSNNSHMNPIFDFENNRFIYAVQYGGQWNIESREIDEPSRKSVLFEGISARPCLSRNCLLFFKDSDPNLYRFNPDRNFSEAILEVGVLKGVDEWSVYDPEHIIYIKKEESINKIIKVNIETGDEELILKSKANMFSLDRENKQIYLNIVSQGNSDLMYFDLN